MPKDFRGQEIEIGDRILLAAKYSLVEAEVLEITPDQLKARRLRDSLKQAKPGELLHLTPLGYLRTPEGESYYNVAVIGKASVDSIEAYVDREITKWQRLAKAAK
jgi:hypothetical protein